jgi:hypothetical protein
MCSNFQTKSLSEELNYVCCSHSNHVLYGNHTQYRAHTNLWTTDQSIKDINEMVFLWWIRFVTAVKFITVTNVNTVLQQLCCEVDAWTDKSDISTCPLPCFNIIKLCLEHDVSLNSILAHCKAQVKIWQLKDSSSQMWSNRHGYSVLKPYEARTAIISEVLGVSLEVK